MINESIAKLVKYGENAGLVSGLDKIYATNRILEVMQISDYEEPEQIPETPDLEETLNELLDDAAKRGLLEHNSVVYRDLFDTKLMDCLMPRPGEVVKKFEELYAKSPQEATDYFYKLSQDSNYIRRYRIAKDIRWSVPSAYGDIDISINLSKPEKDPKAIAAAKLAKQSGYPKCLLCKENVGYAGRVNHPARQNHRIIPLTINQTEWGFQYSPYVYYNEHCIVFNFQHNPMKIERAAFGMRPPARLGPAATDDAAVVHDDTAHRRVRPDIAQPARRKAKRKRHEAPVGVGHSLSPVCGRSSETNLSKSSAAWKFL